MCTIQPSVPFAVAGHSYYRGFSRIHISFSHFMGTLLRLGLSFSDHRANEGFSRSFLGYANIVSPVLPMPRWSRLRSK